MPRRSHLGPVMLVLLGLSIPGCEAPGPIERLGRIETRRDAGARYLRASFVGPSAGIRARAARTAGRMQSARLVDPLVTLLSDADPTVREEAAFALGQIALRHRDAAPRVAHHLGAAILTTPGAPPEPVAELVRALGKTRAVGPGGRIVTHLHDPRPEVAAEALVAYAGMGPQVSAPHFRAFAARGSSELRWRGYYAISRRAEPLDVIELVRPGLVDSSEVVRAWAARAMARGRPADRAARVVATRLASEISAPVQVAMLAALGRLGVDEGLRVAAGFLSSPRPEVRATAARAIAARADVCRETAEGLLAFSRSPDPRARTAIGPALARAGTPATADRLVEMTADPDPVVREAAVRALAELPASLRPLARPAVDDALADPRPGVRAAALDALVVLDRSEAWAVAEAHTASADVGVVVGAIGAYPRLAQTLEESARATRVLLDLYRPSCRPQVTRALLDALAQLPRDGPCPGEIFARDPWPGIRMRAESACRRRHATPDHERVAREPDVAAPLPTSANRPYPDADRLPGRAEMLTAWGRVVIRLHGREAPMTVAHVAELAQDGFFEGVPVHLDAPDSLVAFGCPRGDGLGDLSRTTPSEVGRRAIEAGSVVLEIDDATLAGDSRVFVALRPLPELDGRHVVFGTVVSGMEHVRRLARGQRIDGFRIE